MSREDKIILTIIILFIGVFGTMGLIEFVARTVVWVKWALGVIPWLYITVSSLVDIKERQSNKLRLNRLNG